MIDNNEGLKDRKEILQDLKDFLQYEKEAVESGFYSELDFDNVVKEMTDKLMELHKSE